MCKTRILDLTHTLTAATPVFPGQPSFCYEVHNDLENPELPLYFGGMQVMEHTGTHLDAPAHAIKGGKYVDELTAEQLAGPGVVIDCALACGEDPDYEVDIAAIERFEEEHGPIDRGTIVLLRTGWERFYNDAERYRGTEDAWAWPGLSSSAADLLASRQVRGVGIDTIGVDGGQAAMTLAAHQSILGSGAFILENLANLAELPPRIVEILALPMKIGQGSGAPCRVLARVETSNGERT